MNGFALSLSLSYEAPGLYTRVMVAGVSVVHPLCPKWSDVLKEELMSMSDEVMPLPKFTSQVEVIHLLKFVSLKC